MRLRRLILGRYGHLSDVEIAFPDSPNLHIVLGANEAGKSTALSAIGDCLFRFPHRTPYDFRHATRDLRIGVEVEAKDGRRATFFRRKGRKDDLVDEQDRPLPEAALAAFLSGATRERFDRVFGLNGTELRQGGTAILDGKGEVGEAILGAHTGLHGFRDIVARLEAEAGKLYGNRKGQRAFYKARDTFDQANQDLQDRRVDPAAWKQIQDERAAVERAQADGAARARTLHAERSRLDRIRRTTPARRALTQLLADRAALGVVPPLPEDAAAQYQQAIAAREQAARDLVREQDLLATVEARRAALPEQAPILAVADAIDALAADRQRIAGALKDRETQRVLAAQHAATMVDEGRRLGLALAADDLAGRIPSALDRDAVNAVLRRHERLSGQHAAAVEQVGAAVVRVEEAKAALATTVAATMPATLPATASDTAVAPLEPLRATIDAVKLEGRLDAELDRADRAASAAATDLGRLMSALPLWDRDAAALVAAPVPMDAEIQRVTEVLTARADEVRATDVRLAEHDRALTDFTAQALADAAAGEPPTREVIQAARLRRDAAWALLRRAWLDGGPAVTAQERDALGVTGELGAAFAGLIQQADRLADQRAVEQERVVAIEQRRAEQVRRQALRDADQAARQAAMSRLDATQAEWHALWQSAGIVPAEPAAMREWMQKRTVVLTAHAALLTAERALDGVRTRHAAAMSALSALLPAEAAKANGSVSALLQMAERICKGREEQATRVEKAREAVAAAVAEETKAARRLEDIEAALAAWRAEWAQVARTLSLSAEVPAAVGATALTLWSAIDTANRDRRDALQRIEQMTASIDAFTTEAAPVVGRVAPDLAGDPPLDAVATLAQRLAAARHDARQRQELTDQAAAVRGKIDTAEGQSQAAQDRLEALRHQAGAADQDALRDTLARWTALRELAAKIAEREAELRGLDDGKTLAQLAAEADGVDFDSLPAQIETIDRELRLISDAELVHHETMLRLKQSQAAMEQGRDAAASAQVMETALADMGDIASRYVPLRMAHVLLRAGMERFRRQQQRPLLQRAGLIFARLTEGRYDRLDVDEDEGGEAFVIACQPDGSTCPAGRLSEGTLDQLYLALRLAAIETDARATEPLPFIGDDLLVHFDDRRASAALRVLADFSSRVTQVILFTHHDHIADMADANLASVHRLAAATVS